MRGRGGGTENYKSASCGLLPNEIRDRLGNAVRILRQDRQLTQEDLAEKSVLSVDTVRRLETGTITPSLETLCKLCDGLEVSLRTLFAVFGTREAQVPQVEDLYDALSRCNPQQLRTIARVVRAIVATEAGGGPLNSA